MRKSIESSFMPESELFLFFVRPFNRAGIRYIIGGSVAAVFYGEHRFTNDLDVVVFLNETDVRRLPEMFPSSDFYVPPGEAIMTEVGREQRGHFNIIHMDSSFKTDIYLTGRDEFNAWAFRNKRRVEFQGEAIVSLLPNTSSSASWNTSARAAQKSICGTFELC